MDFVDLDKVLDEFEEEEKQALSIIPGQELKPSGYTEFLEKHQNQDWSSLNPSKFPSYSGYTLERRSVREPVNVPYDDPYDNFSGSKLGLITDDNYSFNGYERKDEGRKRNNQSEIVTNLTRISVNGDKVNTVYSSTNSYDRKGIANSTERKGTIAYQPIEVQTDALSPASEHELMSSPFPKSDIIVDGHGDTSVSCDTKVFGETDQNHSPIYASMDADNLVPDTQSSQHSPMDNNQQLSKSHADDCSPGIAVTGLMSDQNTFSLNTGNTGTQVSAVEETVGFHDTVDEDIDDSEVNMYLNNFDDGLVSNFNTSKDYMTSTVETNYSSSHVPDIHIDHNTHKVNENRSLADELNEAEPEVDHYSVVHDGSQPKKLCSGSEISEAGVCHHQDPDIVADIAAHTTQDILPTHSGVSESSDAIRQRVYNSVMNGRMEIEGILQDKEQTIIGENLMRGKMEIEGILEQIETGKHVLRESDKPVFVGGHNQPDVTQRSDTGAWVNTNDPSSLSPGHTSSGVTNSLGMNMGVGARPKDPSAIKKNRPNSLLGLSKVNLDFPATESVVEAAVDEPGHPAGSEKPSHFPDVTMQPGQALTSDSAVLRDARAHTTSETVPIIHDYSPSHMGSDQDISSTSPPDHQNSQKTKRPTSLSIRRPEFSIEQSEGENIEHEVCSDEPSPGSADHPEMNLPDQTEVNLPEEETASEQSLESYPGSTLMPQSVSMSNSLGSAAPFWIPDADASECMMCRLKFTIWKRRHHCRACGKVFCSNCCSQKALLPYMENKEARVCLECHIQLSLAPGTAANPRCPNPNNPNEYCSKVPPNQQASNHAIPPVVMVPTGVLKPSGSQRRSGEPKQVMFSDGIRPGGDLTELDGPEQTRPQRRSARAARRGPPQHQGSPPARKIKDESISRSPCLIPDDGFPPLYIIQGDSGYIERDDALNQINYTEDYKAEGGPLIYYAVNKNLAVGIKVINMDCCVNRLCWYFVTRGMNTAGQSELVILLELTEEEMESTNLLPPRDMFIHFQNVYEEALKGYPIQDMGYSIFHQNFLGNRDHGGFLYMRPTFQCLNKLPLPEAPYLFGILLQKWEVPWAKVFPIRLLLRLGAEYRYYPCPLVGVRNRKPVFFEIGHTIINLLADFRNYQYMLTQIRGVVIHMENKKTVISFPRNRYNEVMKVVRSSNEHVMALGSSFSSEADSHLVCIQNEDGNYQTQAINIQNKPRLVTGASFVIFNGALKSSSGLRAKSSIVEDGLMVQVLPEAMVSIKEALKEMKDYTILCGPVESNTPEEMVELKWVDNDRNFNIGVKSYIDDTSLEGVESVTVKTPSDFIGENLAIRWTRVYFLQHEDTTSSHFDPLDLSRLTEDIAQACCTALVKDLDELKKEGQIKLGLRVNLTRDSVGYEIGSKGHLLPPAMINNLDTFLVPIVHQASEEGIVMELVFNIVD
ncbi:zinc finger FYVE domain-containing protein 9-like isoform X2 [Physella acuta]|uniref:zinc finger FYVE domain-containing protein 9-like isoform X2 n=1 Tax=Physella acuta TaxID=109671 RepID=UPI0027DBA438|nr:zinc finger FYVE domain-containing protein 9-like isoform X2 [Physella acuta]